MQPLMRFRSRLIVGLVAAAAVLLVVLLLGRNTMPTQILTIHNHTYKLEQALTIAAQQKGLGGRAGMPAGDGMLFVFPRQGNQCFWMKGMRFSLDIIWVDSTKRVTAVEHGLAASTYPQTYCHDGQYVIELDAGQAKTAGIRIGDSLNF